MKQTDKQPEPKEKPVSEDIAIPEMSELMKAHLDVVVGGVVHHNWSS